MPPHLLLIEPLRIARRVAVWALFACLAVGLPLQAVSAVVTGILGPRHVHRAVSAPVPSDDPMAGWKDFRRANYEHAADAMPGAQAHGPAHAHAHEADLRHHHALDDASVIDLDTPAEGDAAPAESPQFGAGVVMAANANRLEPPPRPVAAIDDGWRKATARSFADPFPRRIERPPSRG